MDKHRAWKAVADWYHGFFAGLVLRTVVQRSPDDAARLVFRTFRTQHLNRFLPGLEKLGLTRLPHAVAAAQYHYLSNRIGGVAVEFMPESDRKAWVRFPAPRWVWRGIAICGIPTQVSEAMLRGWQAHNGVSLGNPRLGFVCTKMAVDGDAGLEGYFQEYDHILAPEDRLRFARNEEAPPFDPALAPRLDWPPERLAKAHRAYAMEYVRSALPACIDLFGAETARFLAGGAARLVGMQLYAETAAALDLPPDGSPAGFARFMATLAEAQGDLVHIAPGPDGIMVRQTGWKLMADVPAPHPAVLDCWAVLLDGALAAHNHRLPMRREGLNWRIG
ncbi:MAG: hypothetical protein P4L90_22585 [Rhodopila sp.]|nr:hypothetical protein [Rhodopila sp.]